MCIIMLFNGGKDQTGLTVKQIKEVMKMDDDTCAKNLKSLMLKNYKLLEIRGDTSGGKMTPGMSNLMLKDDSLIAINESFTSPLNRIVFPTPVLEEVYKKGKNLTSFNDFNRNRTRGSFYSHRSCHCENHEEQKEARTQYFGARGHDESQNV